MLILGIINTAWGDTPSSVQDAKNDKNYHTALELLKKRNYFQALPLFQTAMKESPSNIFIKADYLLCLVWMEAYEKAVAFYLNNEGGLKKVKYLTRNLAKAFYETGDYDRATELYRTAILHNPKDREALKGLIYTLCRMGNSKDAHQIMGEKEKTNHLSKNFISFFRAYILKHQGFYERPYIIYSKLTLLEKEENFLKKIQDERRRTIKNLKKEEITYFSEKLHWESPAMYVLLLIDTGEYSKAIETVESFHSNPHSFKEMPIGLLLELGWAYFKIKGNEKAIKIYEFILQKQPLSYLARINLSYALGIDGRFEEAHSLLNKILKERQFVLDSLFAEAFLYEKEKKFPRAIEVYDKILRLKPKNITALKLKIRALSDLGATSYAYQMAKTKKMNPKFLDALKGDLAVNRIRWDRHDGAIKILERQIENNPQNFRAMCDYIVALRRKEEMDRVVEQFKIIEELEKPIPFWVTRAVGDAYLYARKPEEALQYYKMTLEKKPADFDAMLGLFYTYQELRDWNNGERIWSNIKERLKRPDINVWKKMEAFEARGWFLAYEDKLKEAQEYFASYLKKAGMNAGLRTGLGHVFLWRGWPRLALEELKIAQNLDPKAVATLNGIAKGLNELNYEKEARALTQELYAKYPKNKHVQDLYEDLKVEDMRELWMETNFINEHPGASEYWFRTGVTEPISPLFNLCQEITWQKSSKAGEEYSRNRLGLGAEWIIIPEVIWKQVLSFDYEDMDELGYQTALTWLPTDPFKISVSFDSFSLDLPIEARAKGIEGGTGSFVLLYHESDLRHYGLSLVTRWYRDDNVNYNFRTYLNQNILNLPDFKIKLELAFDYSMNEKTDVLYFSPLNTLAFSITPSLQWIHYRRYARTFSSNLYPTFGIYREHEYGYYGIGGITYEQVIDLSKTLAFIWNASWERKVYAGESTDVWNGLIGFRKNF